jgi:hypothetical protein
VAKRKYLRRQICRSKEQRPRSERRSLNHGRGSSQCDSTVSLCDAADHTCGLLDVARLSLMRRLFRTWIVKSSIRFPELNCATSQRGCLPRPAQVSDGFSGLQYFGGTGGYGRRRDTRIFNRFRRSSRRSFSFWIFCFKTSEMPRCNLYKSSTLIRSNLARSMTIMMLQALKASYTTFKLGMKIF